MDSERDENLEEKIRLLETISNRCRRYYNSYKESEDQNDDITEQAFQSMVTVNVSLQRHISAYLLELQTKLRAVETRIKSSSRPRKVNKKRSSFFEQDEKLCAEHGRRSFYFKFKPAYHSQSIAYIRQDSDIVELHNLGYKFVSLLRTPSVWIKKHRRDLMNAIRCCIVQEKFDQLKEAKVEDLAVTDKLKSFSKNLEVNNDLKVLLKDEPSDREFDWTLISEKYLHNRHTPEECRQFWLLVAKPSVFYRPFNKFDRILLRRLALENNVQDWQKINSKMSTPSSEFVCFSAHQSRKKEFMKSRRNYKNEELWKFDVSNEEDAPLTFKKILTTAETRVQQLSRVKNTPAPRRSKTRLVTSREKCIIRKYMRKGYSNVAIAHMLGNRMSAKRVDNICRMPFPRWTRAETQHLLQCVKYIGAGRWTTIAKYMSNKTPEQCRLKYARVWPKYYCIWSASIEPNVKTAIKMGRIKNFVRGCRSKRFFNIYHQKIEHYFYLQIMKRRNNLSTDWQRGVDGKHVIEILKHLKFNANLPAKKVPQLSNWLDDYRFADSSYDMTFENYLTKTFLPTPMKNPLLLPATSKFTCVVDRSWTVLPPNPCNLIGLHTLLENNKSYANKMKNVNFEELWNQIDSSLGKTKKFVEAKLLWYRVLRAMFYWPLALQTDRPENFVK